MNKKKDEKPGLSGKKIFNQVLSDGTGVEERNDGTFLIHRPDGAIIGMAADGQINIDHFIPGKINIEGIGRIVSYTIERTGDIVQHHISFDGGGCVSAAFDGKNVCKSISSTKLQLSISDKNDITLKPGDNDLMEDFACLQTKQVLEKIKKTAQRDQEK